MNLMNIIYCNAFQARTNVDFKVCMNLYPYQNKIKTERHNWECALHSVLSFNGLNCMSLYQTRTVIVNMNSIDKQKESFAISQLLFLTQVYIAQSCFSTASISLY